VTAPSYKSVTSEAAKLFRAHTKKSGGGIPKRRDYQQREVVNFKSGRISSPFIKLSAVTGLELMEHLFFFSLIVVTAQFAPE
jgi:hypothetical protein